jgi:hypothetical protein
MAYKIRTLSTHHWTIAPEYGRSDGILNEYYVENHGSRVIIWPQTWDRSQPIRLNRSNAATWLNDMRKLGAASKSRCDCLG